MIELVNISKHFVYKKSIIRAVDSVNIQIEKGEMVAIMGSSGSGKSTLLNIIGGIYSPTSGEYIFDGQLVDGGEKEMAEFRSGHIGFILQNLAVINNRSVFYNIALPLKYSDFGKNQIKDMVLEVSESLGIADKLKMYPYMLSGGECQRVAIARAVISNPNVILADEPTSSLDDDNKGEVMDILTNLNKSGITVLIATHDNTVAQICDRIIKLKAGKLSA